MRTVAFLSGSRGACHVFIKQRSKKDILMEYVRFWPDGSERLSNLSWLHGPLVAGTNGHISENQSRPLI